MKTLIIMRHSIPERVDVPNEEIYLSKEGINRANQKKCELPYYDCCFCSDYRRARETAEIIAGNYIIVSALHERIMGDGSKDSWMNQYTDHNYKNPGGESLNAVKVRMKNAIDSILSQTSEGKTVLVVSHATAICSYLMNFCDVNVTDANTKSRQIIFKGCEVLNGTIEPLSYFLIDFESDVPTKITFFAD